MSPLALNSGSLTTLVYYIFSFAHSFLSTCEKTICWKMSTQQNLIGPWSPSLNAYIPASLLLCCLRNSKLDSYMKPQQEVLALAVMLRDV